MLLQAREMYLSARSQEAYRNTVAGYIYEEHIMINEQLKEMHYKQCLIAGYQKREKQQKKADSLKHYKEIIRADHGKRSKVFKLERSEEGDTRIRKVRL